MSLAPVDVAGSLGLSILAVAWIHAVAKLPFVLLCLLVGLKQIGADFIEQSLIERGYRKTIQIIVWPLMKPG